MIQAFSSGSFPPIPVLDIALSPPAADEWHEFVPAIVDTGADFTIVPVSLLADLAPPMTRPAFLSSQWRERRSVFIYEVDVRVGRHTLPAVEVVGDPLGNELLLGRNVLNLLDLRLEGPALRTHVR